MDVEDRLKQVKTADNVSLYDHLLNVLGRLAETNPKDPLQSFEDYSQYVKDAGYSYANGKNYRSADGRRDKNLREYLDKTAIYYGFAKEKTGEDGQEDAGERELPQIGFVADLVAEERVFRRAGCGFGERETYRIYTALKKFVQAKDAVFAKFWGKIFGTQKDYYIIETQVAAQGEQEEIQEPHEPREKGINRKIFFVCTDISDPSPTAWVELPLLMPRHIIQARKIRYTFTGNLEAPVNSSPVYPGREKHMLKAQIVRIDFSTDIILTGQFKVNRDDDQDLNPQTIDPVDIDPEDKKVLTVQDKLKLENWHHYSQAVLKEGRVEHAEILDEDDADKKEKLEKQKRIDDPFMERLKPLSKDKYHGLPTCWILRAHGDPAATHRHLFKKNETTSDVVISLRSLVWPGMVYINKNDTTCSMYVGDGMKYGPKDQYFPKFPYLIMNEPVEKIETPDIEGESEPQFVREEDRERQEQGDRQ